MVLRFVYLGKEKDLKDHVQLGHGGLVDIQRKTKHRVSLGATAGNLLQLARSLDMHYVKPLASPFGVSGTWQQSLAEGLVAVFGSA